MLSENVIHHIELNALLNEGFLPHEEIGLMYSPPINQMNGGFLNYSYYTNMFLNSFDELKGDFYQHIISDKNIIKDFIIMLSYYKKNAQTTYDEDDSVFYIASNKFEHDTTPIQNQNSENILINYIGESNIDFVMETISILNWRGSNDKQVKKYNKAVEDHMQRVAELKAKLKLQIEESEGMGVVEMVSSLCARHPSINVTNVKELNYFQIVEQFHRLQMLDTFGRNANAWSSGSLSDDGVKEMEKKHYTNKIKIT